MAPLLAGEDVLRRLFAGAAEQTFEAELGIADPPLVEYLVELLLRFLRQETIYRVRDDAGHRLTQVVDMVAEAEHRAARRRREIYRHVGDFTLFFSGVYPEHLPKYTFAANGSCRLAHRVRQSLRRRSRGTRCPRPASAASGSSSSLPHRWQPP